MMKGLLLPMFAWESSDQAPMKGWKSPATGPETVAKLTQNGDTPNSMKRGVACGEKEEEEEEEEEGEAMRKRRWCWYEDEEDCPPVSRSKSEQR